MKTAVIILTAILFCSAAAAYTPKPLPGNRYGKGQVVAVSNSTRHVQGREYRTDDGLVRHRRVLIYSKAGDFIGYSKLGRQKGDAEERHYFNR